MGDSTAVFGVTDMDYVDFLPSTSATSYYNDDEVGGGGLSSNNCTQVIKQLTLEPQPLRINPIYNKVTLDYTATHQVVGRASFRVFTFRTRFMTQPAG